METTKKFSPSQRISCAAMLGTFLVSVGLLLFVTLATDSEAQVTTNITPTTGAGNLGTIVTPGGATTTITGGTRPGNGPNLFHSFGQFSIAASNTANFSNDSGLTTSNILARVTEGSRSDIFGTIRTTGFGTANLYLLNPAGVVFGPTASLSVGGSVHVSTADYLRFSDGAKVFSNVSPNPSVLTAASPVAFGFLGPTPAGITITQSGGSLSVPSGQTLSLVGGPIQINGSILSAQHGRIQIASVASAGEVIPSSPGQPPGLNVDTFTQLGEIDLSNKAQLTVTSPSGGGTILIRGGKLVMLDSQITADTIGTANGASHGIDINIAGDIVIANPTTPAATQGVIRASTQLPAAAGTGGQAGDVTVSANNLQLSDASAITAFTNGKGTAGNVTVNVGTLTLTGGARIDSSDFSAGSAGTVTINATGSVSVSGPNIKAGLDPSTIATRAQNGVAGQIFISTPTLQLADTGQILASTSGAGHAGDIQVQAQNTQMTQNASVSAVTTGTGPAGNISVTGDTLSILSGARITASTSGAGKGGNITITTTGDVNVQGGSGTDFSSGGIGFVRSGIFAKTQGSGTNAGPAGQIVVNAKNVTLSDGAQIDDSTTSSGAAGMVSITATDQITIEGTNTLLTSGASRGNGQGGSIHLQAGQIQVSDGAAVSASTSGSGNAGSIDLVVAGTLTLANGGTISTNTSGDGNGGKITVSADQILMDGAGSSITADTLHPFADMTVTLSLLHVPDSDLMVLLDSPGGTRVALFSKVGGNGSNFTGTILDDRAANPITLGSAPFTGTFSPREPLAQLVGQPATGTWTLNIQDMTANGNAGSLQNWSLQFGTQVFNSSQVKNILDNGSIQSSVVVNAGSLLVNGVGNSKGNGGDITLNVRSLSLQNGALISTNSTGTGNAGNISITAGDRFVMRDSTVTTQATLADGGNITIRAGEVVQLINSSITTSVGQGLGNGGNIMIDPQFVVLQSGSQILANAFGGNGGNIDITAGLLLISPDSDINASSALGVSGTITINSAISDLSGSLTPLPQGFLRKGALLSSRCAAQGGGSNSSFVVAGREAIPMEPGGLLPSPIPEPGTIGAAEAAPGDGTMVALNLAAESLNGGCVQ
jgi:filamentous hemagglutinin family protein